MNEEMMTKCVKANDYCLKCFSTNNYRYISDGEGMFVTVGGCVLDAIREVMKDIKNGVDTTKSIDKVMTLAKMATEVAINLGNSNIWVYRAYEEYINRALHLWDNLKEIFGA